MSRVGDRERGRVRVTADALAGSAFRPPVRVAAPHCATGSLAHDSRRVGAGVRSRVNGGNSRGGARGVRTCERE